MSSDESKQGAFEAVLEDEPEVLMSLLENSLWSFEEDGVDDARWGLRARAVKAAASICCDLPWGNILWDHLSCFEGFPDSPAGKESPAMQETWVRSLG